MLVPRRKQMTFCTGHIFVSALGENECRVCDPCLRYSRKIARIKHGIPADIKPPNCNNLQVMPANNFC